MEQGRGGSLTVQEQIRLAALAKSARKLGGYRGTAITALM